MKLYIILGLVTLALAAAVQGVPEDVQHSLAPSQFDKEAEAVEKPALAENDNTIPAVVDIESRQFFSNLREKASNWYKKAKKGLKRRFSRRTTTTTTEAPVLEDDEEEEEEAPAQNAQAPSQIPPKEQNQVQATANGEDDEPVELQSRQYWARFKNKVRNYRDRIRNRFSRRRQQQQQPMYDEYGQQGQGYAQGGGQGMDQEYAQGGGQGMEQEYPEEGQY